MLEVHHMLDFRHETFLVLCACGSFTRAAEALHITQPAVSQHIKYLEDYYGCKLFDTSNKKIKLTPSGERMREFVTTVSSDAKHFKTNIAPSRTTDMQFSFGATLSIGEYVMPDILASVLREHPDMKIHMTVANTQILLDKLNHGLLDFIVVEGLFDKSEYETTVFSLEKFIPVCSPASPLAASQVDFGKLTQSRLILREGGSGTREIFENLLQKNNYSLHAFEKVIEIGNMAAIKKLVSDNQGITFLFQVAARKELADRSLAMIDVPGWHEMREFNFVMLKNSFFKQRYLKLFELLKTGGAPTP